VLVSCHNRNNKIQIVGTDTREISELEELPYSRTITDGVNPKDKKLQRPALILTIPVSQHMF